MYHLMKKTNNKKLGKGFACTHASLKTCEGSGCALLAGKTCYTMWGPLGIFIKKLDQGGHHWLKTWKEHLNALRELEVGTKIRLFVSGQIRHTRTGKLDRNQIKQLASATAHLEPIQYQHTHDVEGLLFAREKGLNIIKSCDSVDDLSRDVPNSMIIDWSFQRGKDECMEEWHVRTKPEMSTLKSNLKDKGFRAFQCPATINDDVTCSTCMACGPQMKVGSIVLFPSHGTRKRQIATDHK